VSLPDSNICQINADTTDTAEIEYTSNVNLQIKNPTGAYNDGQKIILRLKSAFPVTFIWGSYFAGSTTVALPANATGSSKTDYMGFMYNSSSGTWQMVAKIFGF
jgi:hypothetical protein